MNYDLGRLVFNNATMEAIGNLTNTIRAITFEDILPLAIILWLLTLLIKIGKGDNIKLPAEIITIVLLLIFATKYGVLVTPLLKGISELARKIFNPENYSGIFEYSKVVYTAYMDNVPEGGITKIGSIFTFWLNPVNLLTILSSVLLGITIHVFVIVIALIQAIFYAFGPIAIMISIIQLTRNSWKKWLGNIIKVSMWGILLAGELYLLNVISKNITNNLLGDIGNGVTIPTAKALEIGVKIIPINVGFIFLIILIPKMIGAIIDFSGVSTEEGSTVGSITTAGMVYASQKAIKSAVTSGITKGMSALKGGGAPGSIASITNSSGSNGADDPSSIAE